jgi:glycosyltransferase involved in cell wall biosynthesis
VLPVTLVIPAHRAEAHIAAAIASVRREPCVPAEILVVDDASPDRSGAVAAAAGANVIRLERNGGPSVARNTGAAAASTPWVAFLDADDVWLPGKLAAQWVALCSWPDAAFCFTDYDAVYADGHVTAREAAAHTGYPLLRAIERAGDAALFDSDSFAAAFVRSMFIRQSSIVVNRALFLRSGGYDAGLRLAEDYDLLLRLAALGPVVAVERSLVGYHRRTESLSADPVAELTAVDRLWETVLREPGRYPATAVELIRSHPGAPLRHACLQALRWGRFSDATRLAHAAHEREPSTLMLGLEVLATAFDQPVGAATFRVVRALWRARHRRAPEAITGLPQSLGRVTTEVSRNA